MLGLGSSLITSGTPLQLRLLGTYTSDFSSGTDGWGDFGTFSGTQTLTANQSIGGESAALKVSYDQDETIQFGIKKDTPWGENFRVGDRITVDYKFYMEDISPEDASNFSVYFQAGSSYHSSRRVSVSAIDGVWATASATLQRISGGSISNSDEMRFGFGSQLNAPGSGDAWYIKDIVIKHFR